MSCLSRIGMIVCIILMATIAMASPPPGGRGTSVVKALDDYEGRRAEAVQQVSVDVSAKRGGSTSNADAGHVAAQALAEKLFSFEMGLEVYDYKYEETVAGRHFMDLQGIFKGLYAKMVWPLKILQAEQWDEPIDEIAIDSRIAWARLDYTGGASDGMGWETPLEMSNTPDMVIENRLLLSKHVPWKGLKVTPFTGFGFRYLVDDSSDQSTIVDYKGTPVEITGYKRKSYYYYFPLGVNVAKTFSNDWQIDMNAEYDHLLSGTQKSVTMEDNERVPTNQQKQGYGFRASMRMAKNFQKYGLSFEPFIRYWDIEDSEFTPTEECIPNTPCWGIIEPSNTTQEIGMKMGVSF